MATAGNESSEGVAVTSRSSSLPKSVRLPAALRCFSIRCSAGNKMGALVALLRQCYILATRAAKESGSPSASSLAGAPLSAAGGSSASSISTAPKLIVFALTCGTVEYLGRVLAAAVYANDLSAAARCAARSSAGMSQDGIGARAESADWYAPTSA